MEARDWVVGDCTVCGAPAVVRRRYSDMCRFHHDCLQHELMICLRAIKQFGEHHKDNRGPNFFAIFWTGEYTLGYGPYVSVSPREAMNEALRTAVRNNWRLLRLDVQGGANHRLYGQTCTDIFVSEDYTKYMQYASKEFLPYDAGEYGEIDPIPDVQKYF
jgi:hypothetical protein